MEIRVLVVDDDPELCELVRFGLTPQGIAVEVAMTGDDAFALVAQSEFHAVVTDLACRACTASS